MKRLIFPITLILMAAMFLSACSAGGTLVNETPGVPQTGQTAVVGTPTGEATTAMTEQATSTTGTSTGTGSSTAVENSTPAGTSTLTSNETSMPTGTSTSTGGTVGTSTPSMGTGTSTGTDTSTPSVGTSTGTGTSTPSTGTGTSTASTPVAGTTSIPVTGATESYVRLSTLLNGVVTTTDGTNVGTLAGVLVQHPVVPAAADSSATPAASPTTAPTQTAAEMAFTVRYVLVDVSSTAGNSSSTNSSSSSSSSQAGNGRLVIIPWQAFDFSTVQAGSAKLKVAGTVISGAPHVSLPDVGSPSGAWFGQLNSYWASQNVTGFTAPSANSSGEANLSLIAPDFRDLAISGPNGEDFGRISDLLIDPVTGQVMYAVFSGGATLNNQVIVIPLNLLDWTAASGTQLGSFAVNIPLDTLQKSPIFQSLQNLTLDPNTVQQLQNFWNTVTPSGSSK